MDGSELTIGLAFLVIGGAWWLLAEPYARIFGPVWPMKSERAYVTAARWTCAVFMVIGFLLVLGDLVARA